MSKKNPHWGTALDMVLSENGIREAANVEAVTRVVAWQLTQEMERQGMMKTFGSLVHHCPDDLEFAAALACASTARRTFDACLEPAVADWGFIDS